MEKPNSVPSEPHKPLRDLVAKLAERWEAVSKYTSDRGYKTALISCAGELRRTAEAAARLPSVGQAPAGTAHDKVMSDAEWASLSAESRHNVNLALQYGRMAANLNERLLATPSPQAPPSEDTSWRWLRLRGYLRQWLTPHHFEIAMDCLDKAEAPPDVQLIEHEATMAEHNSHIIARDEAYKLVDQLREFLCAGSPRKVGEDGALREALEQIASITCSCHDSADADWHGKRCPKGIALAALSLSSAIEPGPAITPQMMSGVFAKSVNNTDPEHDNVYDHRIAAAEINRLLGAQASLEVREALTAEQLQAEWYAVHESTGMNYLTTAGPKWFAAYAERINALLGAGGK